MRPNWFVAFPVSGEPWLAAIAATAPARARTFAPEDLHVTLSFFGPVDERAARAGWAEAALRAPALAPMRARAGKVVPMGSPRHWSALSAEIACEPLVEALRVHAGAVSRAAGAAVDRRPPRPHLTLVRLARQASRDERRAAVRWAEGLALEGIELALSELALYTWSTDRRSAQFAIRERVALGRPTAA